MKFPTYTCHKVVEAATIVDVVRRVGTDETLLAVKSYLANDETYLVQTTVPAMMDKAAVGDYYIVYEEKDPGKIPHSSVSPKKVFEDGYVIDVAPVPEAVPEPRFVARARPGARTMELRPGDIDGADLPLRNGQPDWAARDTH